MSFRGFYASLYKWLAIIEKHSIGYNLGIYINYTFMLLKLSISHLAQLHSTQHLQTRSKAFQELQNQKIHNKCMVNYQHLACCCDCIFNLSRTCKIWQNLESALRTGTIITTSANFTDVIPNMTSFTKRLQKLTKGYLQIKKFSITGWET